MTTRAKHTDTKNRTGGSTSNVRRTTKRRFATLAFAGLVLSAAVITAPYLLAAKSAKDAKEKQDKHGRKKDHAASQSLAGLPATDLTQDEAIVHALNRLGFGPRPGDVDRIKQMGQGGLAKWIDQQLHPESIDDSSVDTRLRQFPTLTMSSATLLEKFPRPQVAAKREGLSIEEYRAQQQERLRAVRQSAGLDARQQSDAANSPDDQQGMQRDVTASAAGAAQQDGAALNGQGNATQGDAMPTGQARQKGIPGNAMMNYQQMQTPQRIVAELAMAKIDRAIYSERQLNEQMVDFWFNHFNVFAGKGVDRWLLTAYERDAIRPNAMGKFRDLLGATAKSPAMLFYLDNWQSADPEAFARLRQQQESQRAMRALRGRFGGPFGAPGVPPAGGQNAAARNQNRGLNENYGRELMELHTLGVNGGYTQQDVIEVAKCFTGWTIRAPQRDAEFWFDERIHDPNPKMVLGHKIKGGGIKDGEEVLDLLARDPHTAHYLSEKIAEHFVSDNPPEALVNRMAETYLKSDGEIRAVLRTMIDSPEFWSRETYRQKIKTPFELVASAARAMNADVEMPLQLVQWTARIGEPLYQYQTPNGYSQKSAEWVNTGALLNRLNYALALTGGRLRGVRVDTDALFGGDNGVSTASATSAAPGTASRDTNAPTQAAAEEKLDRAIAILLSGEVSVQTRQALQKQLENPQAVQDTIAQQAQAAPARPADTESDASQDSAASLQATSRPPDPLSDTAKEQPNGALNGRQNSPLHGRLNDGVIAGLVLGAPEFQRR